METIFFLSAHCVKGPIFAAGSVFVKSGLLDVRILLQEKTYFCLQEVNATHPGSAIYVGLSVKIYEERTTPTYDSTGLHC